MSELRTQGVEIIDGPFPLDEMDKLARAYDGVLASAPESRIGRGSKSTRFSGLVGQALFDCLYLHPPLLKRVSEQMGSPFKLSSLVGRSLHPHTPSPPLHQDVQRGADGDPLVGFIFMVDAFTMENGATRFVLGSHEVSHLPVNAAEYQACGPAGAMVVFNGLIWHEHGANLTDTLRRSVQGYFVRQDHKAAVNWAEELSREQAERLPAEARNLLCL